MTALLLAASVVPIAGAVLATVLPARRVTVGEVALAVSGAAWAGVLVGGGGAVGAHVVASPLVAAAGLGVVLLGVPRVRVAPPGRLCTPALLVLVAAAGAAAGFVEAARPGLAGLALALGAGSATFAAPGGRWLRHVLVGAAVVAVTGALATGPGADGALPATAAGALLAGTAVVLGVAVLPAVGARARSAGGAVVLLVPPVLAVGLLAAPMTPADELVAGVSVAEAAAVLLAVVAPAAGVFALWRGRDRVAAVVLGCAGLALVAALAGAGRAAALLGVAAVLALVTRTPLAAIAALPGLVAGAGAVLAAGGAGAVSLGAGAVLTAGVVAGSIGRERDRVAARSTRRRGAPSRRVPLAAPGRVVPRRPERDPAWLVGVVLVAWLVLAPGTWGLGGPLPPDVAGTSAYRLAVGLVTVTALGSAGLLARAAPDRLAVERLMAWLPGPPALAAETAHVPVTSLLVVAATVGGAVLALVAL